MKPRMPRMRSPKQKKNATEHEYLSTLLLSLFILFLILFYDINGGIARKLINLITEMIFDSGYLCLAGFQFWFVDLIRKLCIGAFMITTMALAVSIILKILCGCCNFSLILTKICCILFLILNAKLFYLHQSSIHNSHVCENIMKAGQQIHRLPSNFNHIQTKVDNQITNKLNEFLYNSKQRNARSILTIQGEKGIGKSTTVHKYINDKLSKQDNNALFLYFDFMSPFSYSEILRQFTKVLEKQGLFRQAKPSIKIIMQHLSSKMNIQPKTKQTKFDPNDAQPNQAKMDAVLQKLNIFLNTIEYLTTQRKISINIFIDSLNKWNGQQYEKLVLKFLQIAHKTKFLSIILISNQRIHLKYKNNMFKDRLQLCSNTRTQRQILVNNILKQYKQDDQYYNNKYDADKVMSLKSNLGILHNHTRSLQEVINLLELFRHTHTSNFNQFITKHRGKVHFELLSMAFKSQISYASLCYTHYQNIDIAHRQKLQKFQLVCTSKQHQTIWSSKMYQVAAIEACSIAKQLNLINRV